MTSMILETDTMFSHREKPWHEYGKTVAEAPTSEEAIKLAGLDWNVQRYPVIVNGEALNDRVALCRDTDCRFFGIVSNNYRVLQNCESFRIMDTIMEQSDSDPLRYETAGSLFNGRKVFMSCAFETEHKVAGDSIKTYLLLSNTHDGTNALHIAITPVRVVCWNTLQAAVSRATSHWSIRHYSTLEDRVTQAAAAIVKAREYMTAFVQAGEMQAETRVGEGTIEALANALFPVDPKLGETHRKGVEKKLDLFERCLNAPDLRQFKGTEWGILNAVSDLETHFLHKKNERLVAKMLNGNMPLYTQAMDFLAQ